MSPRSCPDCRYSGSPGVHWVDPALAHPEFTADELAGLEPYAVPCPAATVDDERQRVEQIVADQHAQAFLAAKQIIRDTAESHDEFSANDCRRELEAAQIPGSVVGAAFTWAQRHGLIEATGRTVASTDEGTHAHRIFLWKSLRYGRRAS